VSDSIEKVETGSSRVSLTGYRLDILIRSGTRLGGAM